MAEFENDSKRISSIINKIPDELLLNIVDKLPVAEAVSTGFLSRKWRDLWKYMTIVRFGPDWKRATGKDITPSLNRFISLHRGQKIKEFSVNVRYIPAMSYFVDSWIAFATRKHVEELYLDFDASQGDRRYQVVSSVFNCKSLTSLRLEYCALKLPASVQLQSLQQVHFCRIELPEKAIYTLTSGSPVLRYLHLYDCNRTRDLCIHVAPDRQLTELLIAENLVRKGKMVLNVPSVQCLEFYGHLLRSEYCIEDITECSSVKFDCDVMFYANKDWGVNVGVNNRWIRKWESLLPRFLAMIQKADSVQLCNWYIKILSLRELRNLRDDLNLCCTSLDITTTFSEWALPGIVYMLKACPSLKQLVIISDAEAQEIKIPRYFKTEHGFKVNTYLKNEMDSVTSKLEHLETIRFIIRDGIYQSWEDGLFEMNDFFEGSKPVIKLAAFLKMTAKNLKSMIFESSKQCHEDTFLPKVEQHQAVE